MKATWNGEVIAETDDTVVVEGNHYFPADSLHRDFFSSSDKKTTCHWKGEASYFDITVKGQNNKAAAWYYPEPLLAAAGIKGRVAFWRGVVVA